MRDISTSSVIIVMKGNNIVQRVVKEDITPEGVCCWVEWFGNLDPDYRCEPCCGLGHIERKCSRNPICSDSSALHSTSTYKCCIVGCIAMQGSLCSHTKEKCSNSNINCIALSSSCTNKVEATREPQQRRRRKHGSPRPQDQLQERPG